MQVIESEEVAIVSDSNEVTIVSEPNQSNQLNQLNQPRNHIKDIYFKWARTVDTFYLPINCLWTLKTLIQHVKDYLDDQNIELVKTMQGNELVASEDVAAVPDSTETIRQYFYSDWNQNYLAFYIRRIVLVEPIVSVVEPEVNW
jgi:hypothetical protein